MDPEDAEQVPEARPPLLEVLWLTKDTVRDKDKVDRALLAQLLAARGTRSSRLTGRTDSLPDRTRRFSSSNQLKATLIRVGMPRGRSSPFPLVRV